MTADRTGLAAVYLARHAEGLAPLQRFVDSYRRHPAGVDHTLVVIFKGFMEAGARDRAARVFDGMPHVAFELDDSGFDIGSYVEACRWLPYDRLCFLNTFTEIAADGWLAMLDKRIAAERVGIVAAMGSYESLLDSNRLVAKLEWLCETADIDADAQIVRTYDSCMAAHRPDWWPARRALMPSTPATAPRHVTALLEAQFRAFWWLQTRAGRRYAEWATYPPFPNPHIRTTGFLVRRAALLGFDRRGFRDKHTAYEFESGYGSLTAQIRLGGQAALVVNSDDREFDVADWWRSGTYRLDDQSKLLVTDGQSRKFPAMDAGSRLIHARMSWGDYLGPPPPDFPDLGVRFPRRAMTVPVKP